MLSMALRSCYCRLNFFQNYNIKQYFNMFAAVLQHQIKHRTHARKQRPYRF